MSNSNDRIISDLKSRQNLIDGRYGKGSTKKLIELSESLSSLHDEGIRVLFNKDLTKEEKINKILDIKKQIAGRILQTRRS